MRARSMALETPNCRAGGTSQGGIARGGVGGYLVRDCWARGVYRLMFRAVSTAFAGRAVSTPFSLPPFWDWDWE